LTSPAIFDLLKHVRWSSWHFLSSLHNLFVPLAGSVAEASRRWVKRRSARRAQSWPSVEGRVQSINVVTGTKFFGSPRQHNATFTYSYSVHEGSEMNYYSGDFSRAFPEADRGWEWLRSLKEKRIRVHIHPEKPEVSVVLAADLDAHYALPMRTPEDLVFARPEIYSQ
jgi:hypothetical protein